MCPAPSTVLVLRIVQPRTHRIRSSWLPATLAACVCLLIGGVAWVLWPTCIDRGGKANPRTALRSATVMFLIDNPQTCPTVASLIVGRYLDADSARVNPDEWEIHCADEVTIHRRSTATL